jgi:hypothetical protein
MDEIASRFPDFLLQLSDFNLERPFRSDGYSAGYFARSYATRTACLVVELCPGKLSDLQLAAYQHQINISIFCSSCPFLVRFLGFTSSDPYCLIYELPANGRLSDMIQNHYHLLTPTQKSVIVFGVAVALPSFTSRESFTGISGCRQFFSTRTGIQGYVSRATI